MSPPVVWQVLPSSGTTVEYLLEGRTVLIVETLDPHGVTRRIPNLHILVQLPVLLREVRGDDGEGTIPLHLSESVRGS